jgi:hypothetical protein
MKTIRIQNLVTIPIACMVVFVMTAAQAADPLPSWSEGAAKQSIVKFVDKVTKEGSPDFVPVAERIATPMVGGIVTSTIMELLVVPAIYFIWRSRRLSDSAPDHLDVAAPAALPTVT